MDTLMNQDVRSSRSKPGWGGVHAVFLTELVRADFLSMPDLQVTEEDACQLWPLDAATARIVLARLLAEGFLRISDAGTFVRR